MTKKRSSFYHLFTSNDFFYQYNGDFKILILNYMYIIAFNLHQHGTIKKWNEYTINLTINETMN